jgi:hypothetical protein
MVLLIAFICSGNLYCREKSVPVEKNILFFSALKIKLFYNSVWLQIRIRTFYMDSVAAKMYEFFRIVILKKLLGTAR